jgi:hypothetical protein
MIKMCSFKKKKCISQIYQRNTSENIERRYLDTVTFLNKVEGDTRFVFVDESGFNNQIIPIFGWARKGQRCVVRTFPQTHNTTVITAITQHDILGFQIFRGSVKGRDFGCFLMNLIEYYPDLLDERCLWIFDNASVHRAEVIKPLLNMLNIEYNTPYSPFLNPIEEVFGLWKSFYRMRESNDEYQVVYNIVKTSLSIQRSKLPKYFLHALQYRKLCLQKEIIE